VPFFSGRVGRLVCTVSACSALLVTNKSGPFAIIFPFFFSSSSSSPRSRRRGRTKDVASLFFLLLRRTAAVYLLPRDFPGRKASPPLAAAVLDPLSLSSNDAGGTPFALDGAADLAFPNPGQSLKRVALTRPIFPLFFSLVQSHPRGFTCRRWAC